MGRFVVRERVLDAERYEYVVTRQRTQSRAPRPEKKVNAMPETADTLNPAAELAAWLVEFSDLGFCLTLTRDQKTDDVIRAYGIDPAQARSLSLDDFLEVDPSGTGGDEGPSSGSGTAASALSRSNTSA
ncbi:hypothetical protein [Streptomyces boluensis]|uniref:Uncharacterized protein n=1 Tax=Streptomyces boluensis TaxID=1775135 RepID=A0A964UQF7_9ACTN|nr:hypothetical protein [Streptomyces boluensis]NBE52520.1 hypothetical protein [Streptomyces boluensis]